MIASELCNGWPRARRWGAAIALVMFTTLIGAPGCATEGGATKQPAARPVDVEAFSRASGDAPTTRGAPATAAADEVVASAPATAPAAVQLPVAAADAPRPVQPGQEIVIESLIGQISGRPIFADAFLAPIDDQLRREGERLPRNEFLPRAQEIVNQRLREVVINELFLAEAEAALTQPQKMGLLAYLKDLQEKNIAERGGTLFGAQAKIASEQEMTMSEFEAAQKNSVLIGNLLYQRISPRVIVSWRDVEREYELRKAEFNPPALVTFQRLQLEDASQKEQIEQVTTRLGGGESFSDVVQSLGLSEFVTVLGGGPLRMGPAGISDVEVNEAFKPALARLKGEAGETTEAIARQGRTVWLHVEKVEQPPGKTIYDVQEELIATLKAQRENEERNKYIATLLQKGIYDELDAMSRRVLAVVDMRYSR